jgi:monoamine oxidase
MTPRIAIVGAGLAGLTAALTLRDAGLSCHVFEASERIGGRMHSDTTSWADGLVSEWCGEFIGSEHTAIHRLIARFGLATAALDQGSAGRAPSHVYLLGRFFGPDELGQDLQALALLLQRQIQEADFPTTYARSTPAGRALDQQSVHAWIERHVAGGHAAPVGRYLDAACTGFYGLDSDEQSALNLVYLFGRLGTDDSSSGSGVPTPLQGNSKIVGGNQQLSLAIARELPVGCLQLGHRLVALERTGERTSDGPLTLTFAAAGSAGDSAGGFVDGFAQVRCDYAILALPFSALRRVDYQRAGFDPLKQTAIEQLGYGTISKLFLQFDTPYWYSDGPWPRPHSGFLITDLDIQTLWDASLGQSGQSGTDGLLVDYTSGHHGAAYAPSAPYSTADDDAAGSASIQRYARECLQQLERVYPGISAHYTGRAALSYPTGDPNLLGSYACWRVGQYTQFGGYEGVRQGPILFAGEHCSVEFQGYMEGAAREGARAAQEIVQEFQ